MCDTEKLSNRLYQFDGFSFYNSLEKTNYWLNHKHEEIQITLPQINSQAWIHYESSAGKQFSREIKADQTFLVSQHQLHQLDWRQTAELTLFYLHPRFLANAVDDSLENYNLEIHDHFSLIHDTLIQEVGVIFRYLCQAGMAMEKLYVENLANLLAVHLLKNYLNYDLKVSSLDRGLSQPKLKRILEYIDTNLDRKITLADLSTIAGLGKFYFCRLFKNSLDATPYQYVLQQRIERAQKLLKYSDLPISDIALDCGFSSQSHLTKHFRNIVKTSPKNYRESNR
ncbi:MAG: AraC family transcriptional regulator [Cyanobacteria bacterium P01_E01_bin.35]